jgi:PD-(D/E)XK nuclease superfamily
LAATMTRGLVFHTDPHRYELDGELVPSVTQVLTRAGLIDFSNVPGYVREAALERGRVVHQAIHYYNEHDLDLAAFQSSFPQYVRYVDAWISFCAQRRFTAVLNETRVASRRHRIAGTLDCLGVLDDVAVLLDFKTGRPGDVAADLQTAAYLALALEWAEDSDDQRLRNYLGVYPVVRRYGVQLLGDGSFRVEAYATPSDWRDFATLLAAQQIVDARRAWIEVAV